MGRNRELLSRLPGSKLAHAPSCAQSGRGLRGAGRGPPGSEAAALQARGGVGCIQASPVPARLEAVQESGGAQAGSRPRPPASGLAAPAAAVGKFNSRPHLRRQYP